MIYFVHEHSQAGECYGWVTQWLHSSEAQANANAWNKQKTTDNIYAAYSCCSCIDMNELMNMKLCSGEISIHEQTKQTRTHTIK